MEDIVFSFYMIAGGACFGIIAGMLAHKKGRDPFAWGIFGFALALLAIPMLLILDPANADKKRCQWCSEWVKKEAKWCVHCWREA